MNDLAKSDEKRAELIRQRNFHASIWFLSAGGLASFVVWGIWGIVPGLFCVAAFFAGMMMPKK